MKKYNINEKDYELVEDYNNGFDLTEVQSKMTEYFDQYDYVFGDWSYAKLRLKGFCNKENPIYKDINDINNKEKHLKDNCAYGCKYFLLKKI
jgi:uncharacterized protein YutD